MSKITFPVTKETKSKCVNYSVGVPKLPHTLKHTDVSLVNQILTEHLKGRVMYEVD